MDPQGNAVGQALGSLGYAGVERVRVGRFFDILLNSNDESAAREQVNKMCEALLANMVIETYQVQIAPVAGK